jgi:hypothetical protein
MGRTAGRQDGGNVTFHAGRSLARLVVGYHRSDQAVSIFLSDAVDIKKVAHGEVFRKNISIDGRKRHAMLK